MERIFRQVCDKDKTKELLNRNFYNNPQLGEDAFSSLKEFFKEENISFSNEQELLIKETLSRISPITARHSIGVVLDSKVIMDENPNIEFDRKSIFFSGLIHDIGKSIVEPEILMTSSRYDNNMKEIMGKHSISSKEVLECLIEDINNKNNSNYRISDFFDNASQEKQVLDNIQFHHLSEVKSLKDELIPEDITSINLIQKADKLEAYSSPIRAYNKIHSIDDILEMRDVFDRDVDKLETILDKSYSKIIVSDDAISKIASKGLLYNDILNDYILDEYIQSANIDNDVVLNIFVQKEVHNVKEAKEKMNLDVPKNVFEL